jgi:hypothetical protein
VTNPEEKRQGNACGGLLNGELFIHKLRVAGPQLYELLVVVSSAHLNNGKVFVVLMLK